MRSLRLWAAGLLLFPVLGVTGTVASGQQLRATDPRTGLEPQAVTPPAPARPTEPVKKDGDACHGTSVEFVETPREAAELAKKQEKLVFVLHVSGHFEDPRFT